MLPMENISLRIENLEAPEKATHFTITANSEEIKTISLLQKSGNHNYDNGCDRQPYLEFCKNV